MNVVGRSEVDFVVVYIRNKKKTGISVLIFIVDEHKVLKTENLVFKFICVNIEILAHLKVNNDKEKLK